VIKDMSYGEEYEVGVEFVDLPPEITDYLITYIRVSLNMNRERTE